jgi:hypothetical protein
MLLKSSMPVAERFHYLSKSLFMYLITHLFIFISFKHNKYKHIKPIPVAALSKAWVSGRSLGWVVGSNPAESYLVSAGYCPVEVSASG